MAISRVVTGSDCELVVTGRVDGPVANDLEREVTDALRAGIRHLMVNFAGADFLCSAGIRVVLQHHRQWKAQGRRLFISRTSPEVDHILELTGLRDVVVERPAAS